MNSEIKDDRDLARALGKLPRGRSPRRDLWPGIAARLRQQPAARSRSRGWRAMAVAASVAVAFAAGILLGQRMDPGHGPATMPGVVAGGPSLMTTFEASEREYQAALRALAPISVAPAVLGTRDVEDIQGSWTALQQAEAALLEALHQYPDNPFLGQKLLDLRAQQLDFLKQLHMLEQTSRRSI